MNPSRFFQLFRGNYDRYIVVTHTLNRPITARYIRVHPRAYRGWMSMRVEFYGCIIGQWFCNFWMNFFNGCSLYWHFLSGLNTLYILITFASYIRNKLHQRLPLVHLSPPFPVPPSPPRKKRDKMEGWGGPAEHRLKRKRKILNIK